MVLLCRLIGHKWTKTRVPSLDEMQEQGINRDDFRIRVTLSHCRRCGEPNPAWKVENDSV